MLHVWAPARRGAVRRVIGWAGCTYLMVVLYGRRLQELHGLALKEDLLEGEQGGQENAPGLWTGCWGHTMAEGGRTAGWQAGRESSARLRFSLPRLRGAQMRMELLWQLLL